MGETVRLVWVGDGSRTDIYTIDENTYDNYKERYWVDSEEWLWTANGGKIVITTAESLTPTVIQQLYRQNETSTCVFDAMANHLGKSKSAERMTKMIVKYKKKYPAGVNENEMGEIANKMNIKMTIHKPFNQSTIEYGHNPKPVMSVQLLNISRNHVVNGTNMMFNPVKYVEEMPNDAQFYNVSKTTMYFPTETLKLDNVYRREQELFFSQLHPLDNNKQYALSQFVLGGTYQTGSYLFKETKKAKHIDHKLSYTQFKRRGYKGFPNKITDFRRTNVLEGVGYYYVGSLDWTNANKKLKQLNQLCKMFVGKRIYPSCEIEMLMRYGVVVRIYFGCWGTTIDLEFSPEQIEKFENVRIYARLIGTMRHMTKTVQIFTKSLDPEFIGFVGGSKRFGDDVMFEIPVEKHNHYAHIAGFMYGYQRINLVAQLLEMNIEKIGRINVDGIYYEPHSFNLLEDFREKTGKFPNAVGNRIICESPYDKLEVYRKVIATKPRPHFKTELYKGAGGTGKSYYNINDTGLVSVLYVAVCRLLLQGKECDTATLQSLFNEHKWACVNRHYSVLIVDECSMLNEEQKKYLLAFKGKIIFIGDVDFQIEPVQGVRMNETGIENVVEMNVQYRCKCPKLSKILDSVRDVIAETKFYLGDWNWFPLDSYVREDTILCHKHKTIEEVNLKLVHIPTKYRITENGKNTLNGEIYLEKPDGKFEETHAFTVHTLQGQTCENTIWIHREIMGNAKLFYTALSRATSLSQIKIF
jgi:hypothetical protein